MSADDRQWPAAPFVVGASRSGTTLLRLILDSHPALAIPPETHFGDVPVAFAERGAAGAVAAIVGSEYWGDYGLAARELERAVAERGASELGDVLRCFFELYARSRGKPRWGNKTPYYVARMTAIQGVLPEARFVHIVRDGRDVALSMAPLWFGAGSVAGVAREWAGLLRSARRQARSLRHYTEVRYESLVRDPVPTVRRLCEFLDLEWEPSMLDYHRGAGAKLAAEAGGPVTHEGRTVSAPERAAVHRRAAAPPDPSRAEAWRREMGPDDLRAFEREAGETLRAFGYEPG